MSGFKESEPTDAVLVILNLNDRAKINFSDAEWDVLDAVEAEKFRNYPGDHKASRSVSQLHDVIACGGKLQSLDKLDLGNKFTFGGNSGGEVHTLTWRNNAWVGVSEYGEAMFAESRYDLGGFERRITGEYYMPLFVFSEVFGPRYGIASFGDIPTIGNNLEIDLTPPVEISADCPEDVESLLSKLFQKRVKRATK